MLKGSILIIFCLLFIFSGLFFLDEITWVLSILVGLGSFAFIINYFTKKPDSRFIKFHNGGFTEWIGRKLYDEHMEREFRWSDIVKIIAYKIDRLTFDDICITCTFQDGSVFTVSEVAPEWDQFIKQMDINLAVMPDWLSKVVLPAFARNETVIYEIQWPLHLSK